MLRSLSLGFVVAAALACAPKPAGETDGDDVTSEASSGASSSMTDAPPDLPPDLPPVDRCGDGVLDPGEACDDGDGGCDACTEACTLPVEPALEWSVALAPIVEVLGFDVTQTGRAWVLGETAEAWPRLLQIEAGAVVASIDLAGLGFASAVTMHVNSAAVDGVEVAIVGRTAEDLAQIGRFDAQGAPVEVVPIAAATVTSALAATSAGFAFAGELGVRSFTWAGEPLATLADTEVEFLDAVGDRFVLGGETVALVAADGSDLVDTVCSGQRLSTAGSHVVKGRADSSFGEIFMTACGLTDDDFVSGRVIFGDAGLEVAPPEVEVVDAAPNGHPIGRWRICPFGHGSTMGCVGGTEAGLGGPDDPHAVELDGCDAPETARVGQDRGVLLIRRDRATGAPSLVRRGTLPASPPWA